MDAVPHPTPNLDRTAHKQRDIRLIRATEEIKDDLEGSPLPLSLYRLQFKAPFMEPNVREFDNLDFRDFPKR